MSLPYECFSNILYFLDEESLYKCLFVNRHWCRFSVIILWREPFNYIYSRKFSGVINTLLSCLDENEISSLIPCRLNFNNQIPLFEYGKFIRKIDHENFQNCRFQKLANAIYHLIMRQGSNLQEFSLTLRRSNNGGFIDIPRFSIFTAYNPGI